MDTTRFDCIVATLSEQQSRRGALRALGAALAAGGITALAGLGGDAKRKKRKNKGKHRSQGTNQGTDSGQSGDGGGNGSGQPTCSRSGSPCTSHDQCCYSTTNNMCAVSSYASNSDKTCCGGQGAICGPRNDDGDYLGPHCCAGYECVHGAQGGHGSCQLLAEL